MNRRRWRSPASAGPLRLIGLLSIAAALVLWQARDRPRDVSAIVGFARVIDGDTLDISGRRVRLQGIDAPEATQTCVAGGQAYRCGAVATLALGELLRGRIIRCAPSGADRYGRTLADCWIDDDGTDISRWMVRQGLAVAYRHYSYHYLPDELLARLAGRGLWAGSFTMPWDFRVSHSR